MRRLTEVISLTHRQNFAVPQQQNCDKGTGVAHSMDVAVNTDSSNRLQ
jgi:hypothetical protein